MEILKEKKQKKTINLATYVKKKLPVARSNEKILKYYVFT